LSDVREIVQRALQTQESAKGAHPTDADPHDCREAFGHNGKA
jgi:hypothetical protein